MLIKTKKLFDQIHRTYITPAEDKILKELSTYGDWNSGSYIRCSISTIARNTKLHERTVYRAMKKLRDLRVIRRVRPHSRYKRHAAEYMINFQTVHCLVYDSVELFALDRRRERARLLRKEDRRLERLKDRFGISYFPSSSESVDNLKKYRENRHFTPDKTPGNNRAIDTIKRDNGKMPVDNLLYRPPIRPPT